MVDIDTPLCQLNHIHGVEQCHIQKDGHFVLPIVATSLIHHNNWSFDYGDNVQAKS